jgi:hypothetical protein
VWRSTASRAISFQSRSSAATDFEASPEGTLSVATSRPDDFREAAAVAAWESATAASVITTVRLAPVAAIAGPIEPITPLPTTMS